MKIVRADPSAYERTVLAQPPITVAADVAALMSERLCSELVEVMIVVGLDGGGRPLVLHEVARGSIRQCVVTAADILRVVLVGGATSFVLAHNHPSGHPFPSREDLALTKAVEVAADVVGVQLVDHVILGSPTRYFSFADHGIIPAAR